MAILAVQSAVRQIARRTGGRKHGPIVRLISPADFGEILKPFIFLDFLDHDVREPITSGLHPHSGIATVSHLTEGSVNYLGPPDQSLQTRLEEVRPLAADNDGGHQAVKMLPATSMVCRQTVNRVVNVTSIFVNFGGYAAHRRQG